LNSANKKGLAARKLAVSVLVKVEKEGAYANLALANALKGDSLSQRDKAFVMALVLGVLRNQKRLDGKLAALSKEPLIKLKPHVRNLLRVAIFQLDHMADIPESAVVDTAVELGRNMGHVGISRYVNGVLRTYLRERPAPTGPEAGEEVDERFDLRYQDNSQTAYSGNYSSQLDHNQHSMSTCSPNVTACHHGWWRAGWKNLAKKKVWLFWQPVKLHPNSLSVSMKRPAKLKPLPKY